MSGVARPRILIYRIGSLGDTVIALPVFHKVLQAYPNADITLLTNKPIVSKAAPLESVLGSGYFFHRVLNYPTGTRNARVLLNLIKDIRALKIDIVINLATTRILKDIGTTRRAVWRDKLFFKAAGASKLIGFPEIRPDFELTTDAVSGEYEWEAMRLARRLHQLGPIDMDDDANWDMRFTAEELATADDAISSLDSSRPILSVCAGTKMQSKDWEEANWLGLLCVLKPLLPGWQLAIVGAPDEAERAEKCLAIWGNDAVNLCGKTSPRVSGAVLQKARIFIGHDSGPMHLAAAVGTPCVAIYSARNLPRQWYPRGKANKIIHHLTNCAGCVLEVCTEQKKKCILSVSINEVKDAVLEVLVKHGHLN